MTLDAAFGKLAKSKFRSRFKLSAADVEYVAEKGVDAVRRHAEDFVRLRLAPARPPNDGRQTPMRGHPVFKAQHATATCCRGCMNKWWKVPLGVELSPERQRKTVDLIMAWIGRQISAWGGADDFQSAPRGLCYTPNSFFQTPKGTHKWSATKNLVS